MTTENVDVQKAVDGILADVKKLMDAGEIPAHTYPSSALAAHTDMTALFSKHTPARAAREEQADLDAKVVAAFGYRFNQDFDPWQSPPPSTPEQIRDILHAMLEMSHDECQWGTAETTEFTPDTDAAHPSLTMDIGGERFRVEVRKL
ncbi:hypothetical protein HYQ19_gp034 [Arthrobacter phage DrYang]|uniref:Uncharacterized protein n=1 Tax=Arthrobacter phage DrYang TaxID=2686080 RepID=A0A6B9JBX4_9CAUD|nr:hypothetical protein HYQ19_gp034 [Arthrobacter phage DrYang]QGZ17133.1 hypothetical protein SEA_DRYANG_34 [Arthrobacter phage DrYang]